jgi:hypothetical protein
VLKTLIRYPELIRNNLNEENIVLISSKVDDVSEIKMKMYQLLTKIFYNLDQNDCEAS